MSTDGYWGAPTSSVDWCEPNYVHSLFICEAFNTLSSLAMIGAGVVGLWLHWRVLEKRFAVAFALLAVVGLGSIAFHATLRFELQMMDELPMTYLVIWMVYLLVEGGPARRGGPALPLALGLYAVAVTFLCSFTRGQLQFLFFHLTFGSLELFCLWKVFGLYRRTSSLPVRRLYRWGMGAYALAVTLWFLDLEACARLPFTLHPAWHVLVSAGFYALLLVVAHEAEQAQGRAPVLTRWLVAVPRLSHASDSRRVI